MDFSCRISLASPRFSRDQNVKGPSGYAFNFGTHCSRLLTGLISKEIFGLRRGFFCGVSLNMISQYTPRGFALALPLQNGVLFCFWKSQVSLTHKTSTRKCSSVLRTVHKKPIVDDSLCPLRRENCMERPEEERICGSPPSRNLSRQCCAPDSFVP